MNSEIEILHSYLCDTLHIQIQAKLEEVPSPEGAACELEIWNYDPSLFAKNNTVDPFSLYL